MERNRNLNLKGELEELKQLVESKITPEVNGLVNTGINSVKLLMRGKVKPSKKNGIDWLFENIEENLSEAINNATDEQLAVVGKKLYQIGWQILRDIKSREMVDLISRDSP